MRSVESSDRHLVAGEKFSVRVLVRSRSEHTYFSSAVWAAIRVRSDLSARGQPDRLEGQKVRKRR